MRRSGRSQKRSQNRSPLRSAPRVAGRSAVKTGRATAKSSKQATGLLVAAVGRSAKDKKKAVAEVVHAVEIRPAGTVVSRRPLKKRVAVRHLPQHPILPLKPPSWMLEECHVAPARAGDQIEILQLLSGLPAAPSKAEFHAAVDHPDHDAANRLVARLAGRIVGHVEVVPRAVLVGGISLPAAVIDRVAVLPECRGAGHGQRLVRAAEDRMRQIGAAIGFSRTRIAPSFHELGWAVLGRDCATPGRPTEILARLLDGPQREGETVTMRQWRHVERSEERRVGKECRSRWSPYH